jgi:hypothetical protein
MEKNHPKVSTLMKPSLMVLPSKPVFFPEMVVMPRESFFWMSAH